MRVFISWSGDRSRRIADILRRWLPGVLQAVRPYFSPDDVAKGARWTNEISKELEASEIGLLILTRENLHAPWLMFEAGALAKNLDRSKVCPLIFGLEPSDIVGPLVQFQASSFTREEMQRVIKMMNAQLGEGELALDVLERAFDMWWPQLAADVEAELQRQAEERESRRSDRDVLEEVLALTRSISHGVVQDTVPARADERSLRETLALYTSKLRTDFTDDRRAVAQDVWKAVTGRLVHPSISEEIDNIIKSTFSKYDVRYRVTLCKEPYINVPAGFVVVRRELRYSLLNMLGRSFTHYIPSSVVSHTNLGVPLRRRDGETVSLPRHIALRINGQDIPTASPTEIRHAVDLTASDEPQHEVEISSEELLRENDRNVYITVSLSVQFELQIVNELRDLIQVTRVDFLHPSPQLFQQAESLRWQFPGAMLPGQGFIVTWASSE